MKTVTIYTDGACSGNPGPGGWCAILEYNGHEKLISGGEERTTNNRILLVPKQSPAQVTPGHRQPRRLLHLFHQAEYRLSRGGPLPWPVQTGSVNVKSQAGCAPAGCQDCRIQQLLPVHAKPGPKRPFPAPVMVLQP